MITIVFLIYMIAYGFLDKLNALDAYNKEMMCDAWIESRKASPDPGVHNDEFMPMLLAAYSSSIIA